MIGILEAEKVVIKQFFSRVTKARKLALKLSFALIWHLIFATVFPPVTNNEVLHSNSQLGRNDIFWFGYFLNPPRLYGTANGSFDPPKGSYREGVPNKGGFFLRKMTMILKVKKVFTSFGRVP